MPALASLHETHRADYQVADGVSARPEDLSSKKHFLCSINSWIGLDHLTGKSKRVMIQESNNFQDSLWGQLGQWSLGALWNLRRH